MEMQLLYLAADNYVLFLLMPSSSLESIIVAILIILHGTVEGAKTKARCVLGRRLSIHVQHTRGRTTRIIENKK